MPTGSCLCGDLSYSFSGEPLTKVICHCMTCRKLTGSAYSTALMVPDPEQAATSESPAETPAPKAADFKVHSKTNSAPRQTTGIHETGLGLVFNSCSKCPSTLFKTAKDGFPGMLILFGGCLDGEDGPGGGLENLGEPQAELWVKYRLPWVKEIEGAKQCQEFT